MIMFVALKRMLLTLMILLSMLSAGCRKQENTQPIALSEEGVEEICVETISWENVLTENWN